MRRKSLFKRIVAFALAGVLMFNVAPMGVTAEDNIPQVGTEEKTTNANYTPAAVENCVWERTEVKCDVLVEHTHGDSCYLKSCNHKNGHLSTCYSTATEYEECPGNHEHSGEVTLADVVEIKKSGVTWTTEHPAYNAVYAKYKDLYENGGCSNKHFLQECKGLVAVTVHLLSTKFCYTVSTNTTPDLCTHECSNVGGECYTKICILSEHTHNSDSDNPCNYYSWKLYADVNNNGTPDEREPKYTIKYVNEGTTLQSESVLEGMSYPTYKGKEPTKEADAQYTYSFSGWNPALPAEGTKVTGDVTHTAQYDKEVNEYTITWLDEDGSELAKTEVAYGEKPVYPNATPTKDKTDEKVYTFAGWKLESTGEVGLVKVTGDATYRATFSDKDIFTVVYKIDDTTETKYVVDGEKAENYALTREYYTLDGWYTDDTYTSEFNFETAIERNTELFAKWVPVNDVNKDNIADEEQACGINVSGDVTADVSGNKLPGETVTITATPKDGKFITGVIKVNGAVYETEVTFADTKATFSYTLPAEEAADYTFEVLTADVSISLYSEYINWNELLTAAETEELLFENVNWGEMPETVSDNTKVEYLEYNFIIKSWKNIGTDEITPLIGHAFGDKEKETILFTFAGNDQIPAFTAEFDVLLKDERQASKLTVNENVTFTYSPAVTEEKLAEAVFKKAFVSATSEDGTIELEAEYNSNIFVKDVNVNAGTHTVVIDFYGTKDYAASSAEVTVVIEKADATVTMTSNNVVLYSNVSALTKDYLMTITSNTEVADNVEHIYFVMGLDAKLNDAAKPAIFAEIDLSQTALNKNIGISGILDANVADELIKLLGGEEGLALDDLLENADNITGLLEKLGIDTSIVTQYVDTDTLKDSLKAVYAVLKEYEEYGDVYVKFTNNDSANPQLIDSHGIYLVGAVTTDANYNTAANATVVVVTAEPVEVVFDDVNGNNARLFTYDGNRHAMTAKAYDKAGNELPSSGMKYLYVGVESDGEPYYSTEAPTETGTYAVTAVYASEDKGLAGAAVGTMVIQPADAVVAVDNATHVYDGEEFDVTTLIHSTPEDAKIAILTAGLVLEDGTITSVDGTLNIDLPERAENVFEQVFGTSLNDYEITKEDFVNAANELKSALESVGIDASVIDEVINVLNQVPDVVTITFKDQKDVNPSEIGVYFVGAVVFDPNYVPEAGAGILVITPEEVHVDFEPDLNIDNAREFVYDGTVKEMPVVVKYFGDDTTPKGTLTVKYVGVDSQGNEYNDTKAPTNVGVYSVIAIYEEYEDEQLVAYGANVGLMAITPAEAKAEVAIDDILCGCGCDTKTCETMCAGKTDCGCGLDVLKYIEAKGAVDKTISADGYVDINRIAVVVDEAGNVNILLPTEWNVDSASVENDIDNAITNIITEIAKLEGLADSAAVSEAIQEVIDQLEALETGALSEEAQNVIDGIIEELESINTATVKAALNQIIEEVKALGLTSEDGVNAVVTLLESLKTETDDAQIAATIDTIISTLENVDTEKLDAATKAALAAVVAMVKDLDITELKEAAKTSIDDIIEELKNIDTSILSDKAKEVIEAVATELEALKANVENAELEVESVTSELIKILSDIEAEVGKLNSVSVNGAQNYTCGTYTVYALAFGPNHKVAVASDTFKIYPPEAKEEEQKPGGGSGSGSGSGSSSSSKDDSGSELVEVHYASSSETAGTAQTGDSANILGYAAAILVAGAALVLLYFKKKRA